MKITQAPPSKESMVVLESLQKAVARALDRKKRLGQYAVVWQDGKPVIIGGDMPEAARQAD